MFGKKNKLTPEQKAELKKRKFLSKKFANVATSGKVTGGATLALAVPLAFVDGGLSLFALAMMGGTGALTTALMSVEDFTTAKENKIYTHRSGQFVYGEQWAHTFFVEVENELIKTCDKIKYLSDKDVKKRTKLESKKEKLLDVGRDLSAYLKVANKLDQPTGEPLLIMTRTPTKDQQADKAFKVSLATTPPENKPRGLGL